jgi:hypothetical protein
MNADATGEHRPMYGYLRVLPKLDEQVVSRLTCELADFAEQSGFTLLEVFVEEHWLRFTALDALYFHCQTNGVHHVVVPTIRHLHQTSILGLVMQDEIQQAISGQVWIMWPEAEEAACVLGRSHGEERR